MVMFSDIIFLWTQISFHVSHTQKFSTVLSVAYNWTKGWQIVCVQVETPHLQFNNSSFWQARFAA